MRSHALQQQNRRLMAVLVVVFVALFLGALSLMVFR
jgi:hypothetical protein